MVIRSLWQDDSAKVPFTIIGIFLLLVSVIASINLVRMDVRMAKAWTTGTSLLIMARSKLIRSRMLLTPQETPLAQRRIITGQGRYRRLKGSALSSKNDVVKPYEERDVSYSTAHTDAQLEVAYLLYKSEVFDENKDKNLKNQGLSEDTDVQTYSSVPSSMINSVCLISSILWEVIPARITSSNLLLVSPIFCLKIFAVKEMNLCQFVI